MYKEKWRLVLHFYPLHLCCSAFLFILQQEVSDCSQVQLCPCASLTCVHPCMRAALAVWSPRATFLRRDAAASRWESVCVWHYSLHSSLYSNRLCGFSIISQIQSSAKIQASVTLTLVHDCRLWPSLTLSHALSLLRFTFMSQMKIKGYRFSFYC